MTTDPGRPNDPLSDPHVPEEEAPVTAEDARRAREAGGVDREEVLKTRVRDEKEADPDHPQALEKGTSLWADAWRRLRKNKAALAGAAIVLFMGVCALLLDPISRHLTHFSFDEQHLAREPKPVGARSVPQTYYTLDAVPFDAVDADGDGAISPQELAAQIQQREFQHYDTDGDGAIGPDEFAGVPVTFHGRSAAEALALYDRDGSGNLAPEESRDFTNLLPLSEAAFFISRYDEDGSRSLYPAEYPGVPQAQTHYLGTDELGRDMLTRLIMGARVSLAVGLIATLVSFIIGVLWGATAGFLGGAVDNAMMRFVDVMYGLPFIFLVILLMVIFQDIPSDKKLLLLFFALGAVQWLTMSRIVRGQVISLKENEFVEAARAIGVSRLKIIFRHLIPNALGPIIVYATLTVPAVMLEEAFLSFLGLGVQAPYASWGSLAAEGGAAFREYPWLIIFPGAALAVTLLSLNFLGDGLRDALDPQARQ